MKTSIRLVSDMNTAFGAPKGDPNNIDWSRVRKQCLTIPDETGELFIALGSDPVKVKAAVKVFKEAGANVGPLAVIKVDEVRDALCDIPVFALGAEHFMGVNGDTDMEAVVAGVMPRFIKDDADKEGIITLHAANGVSAMRKGRV